MPQLFFRKTVFMKKKQLRVRVYSENFGNQPRHKIININFLNRKQ